MNKKNRAIVFALTVSALLFVGATYAQTGQQLFINVCAVCHNGTIEPANVVNNAAGNAALIATVNGLGMGAKGSDADFASIAAYLDTIRPDINLAPVAHNSSGKDIQLGGVIVAASDTNPAYRIITDIVTITPPTRGTVTYSFASGGPSVATYTPFLEQSGMDTWTYQGVGDLGSTTVRTASVNIAAGAGPPVALPDLNQHGMTGSWWEPATSGQGFELEVFPNPSSGTAFLSWFTYDTVIGGAEHQRWYTALGKVAPGASGVALTIYQNVGGNFNAPPVTTARAIGTAILSFDTCNSGQLTYQLIDGTFRSGAIPLSRLTKNVTCSTTAPPPTNADFAFSGNWFTPATSGQGFTIDANPNSNAVFAAWYTYVPSGAAAGPEGQRWYTAQGPFTPGLRSIPVTISETTGGMFDTPTPPGQKTTPVGSGTLTFQNCSAATFAYNFTGGTSSGLSGSIVLSRVGPVPPGCTS
jgi:hypothetical protein